MRRVKPQIKQGKIDRIKCELCEEPTNATHSIVLNLRERPGPPIVEDNVIRTVCDEHAKGDFNDLIPAWMWDQLCKKYKNEQGKYLSKQYSDVQVVKIKFKDQ